MLGIGCWLLGVVCWVLGGARDAKPRSGRWQRICRWGSRGWSMVLALTLSRCRSLQACHGALCVPLCPVDAYNTIVAVRWQRPVRSPIAAHQVYSRSGARVRQGTPGYARVRQGTPGGASGCARYSQTHGKKRGLCPMRIRASVSAISWPGRGSPCHPRICAQACVKRAVHRREPPRSGQREREPTGAWSEVVRQRQVG